MFKNFLTTALRNIWRHKSFAAINIIGLAIGISAALVIYLIVTFDFSFDKKHYGGERIYRIVSNFQFSGQAYYNSGVPDPMGEAAQKELTGPELVVPFRTWSDDVKVGVQPPAGGKPVVFRKQKDLVFADQRYFDLIDYDWVAGSKSVSLDEPAQVVLTESKLANYFPGVRPQDVIGRTITFNDTLNATISGVVKDLTYNTDFNFKTFVSHSSLEQKSFQPHGYGNWNSTTSSSQLFIRLKDGVDPRKVVAAVEAMTNKYVKPDPGSSSNRVYTLQPLKEVHFDDRYGNFDQRLAHRPTLMGLLAVGIFLLVLGCINFINLTTAQASQRMKEIGVRKTMGSSRRQLVVQFLSETFVLTLIATVLSIIITPFLLRIFSDFIPTGLKFSLTSNPELTVFLLLLVLSVSLLSGMYPALYLSSLKPVVVLKNMTFTKSGTTRSAWLRKSLTVTQFVIAQVFIVATILVGKQIAYSLNKDMGFRKDAIIHFATTFHDTAAGRRQVLADQIRSVRGVTTVSLSTFPPSSWATWSSIITYPKNGKEETHDVDIKLIDTNFRKLYQIKLIAGRDLPASDTPTHVLINQLFATQLGFRNPQDAIGKIIDWDGRKIPVIGVIGDFHQKSLHLPIRPLLMATETANQRTFNVGLQNTGKDRNGWKETIAGIEKAYKKLYPGEDFEYRYYDEDIARFYQAEQNVSRLLKWATGLSVFISCLGLLGLAIYITNQRTKEIGIRKVIGASVLQIVSLLSKDFIRLIAIAVLIAIPIAWYGANRWLDNFVYRTSLSWTIFLSGGLLMIAIALLVLTLRTLKAATANPVDSLRSE
jgi:putative ABC transport system permease protein